MLKLGIAYAVKEEVGFEALVEAPLDRVLRFLSELGYNGIELNIANPMKFDTRFYKKKIEDYGFEVPVISTGLSYLTYGYSLASPDEEKRRKAIEFFLKYAEIAYDFGCKRVVIGLARGRADDIPREEALKLLKSSIIEILEKTEDKGIVLLLEPLNRYETRIVNNVREFIEVYNDIGSPRLKMLFDTYHLCLEERDMYRAILEAKRYIGYVHLAENNRLAPGLGMIDWLKVIALLKAIGYDYYVTIEAIPKPSFEDMTRIGASTIRPLLDLFK